MDITRETPVYETRNVDLATFLLYEGIKLIECVKLENKRNVVIMRFLDDKGACRDLERVYINSEFKKFRDLNKWILSKIHEKLREE